MLGYGFKGLGWFLCGMIVAPVCYLMTSQVAAERAELARVQGEIVAARKNIRALEIEFAARANYDSLLRLNGQGIAMGAGTPDQYLRDASALASYDPSAATPAPQYAALELPAGMPRVLAAAMPAAAPGGARSASAAPAAAASVATAARRAGNPLPVPTNAPVARGDAVTLVAARYATRALDRAPSRAASGAQLAMLDDGLLSAATQAKIQERMLAERAGLR